MAVSSFTSELLSSEKITPEAENDIKWSAASIYGGTLCLLHPMKYPIYSPGTFVLVLPGAVDTVQCFHLTSCVHGY